MQEIKRHENDLIKKMANMSGDDPETLKFYECPECGGLVAVSIEDRIATDPAVIHRITGDEAQMMCGCGTEYFDC